MTHSIRLEHPASRHACLLLHGLASSPWELRDLAEFLHSRGWTVSAPLLVDLRHHEPDSFRRLSPETWLDPARQELDRLLHNFPATVLIGTSMGGVLAALLATDPARSRHISALVLANPPFRYRNPFVRLLTALPLPLRGFPAKIPEGLESEYFPYFPFRALRILRAMAAQALRHAPAIRQPLLILSSAKDRSVDPEALRTFLANAGSAPKELLVLPDAPHSPFAPHYPKNRDVFNRILPFLAHSSPTGSTQRKT